MDSRKFSEKAQEISYALLRIAIYMRRKDFRLRTEELSLEFLECVSREDVDNSLSAIAALTGLLKLGAQVYEVETVNARVILEELGALEASLRKHFGREPLPDIQSLFTADDAVAVSQDNSAIPRQNPINSAMEQIGNKIDTAMNAAKDSVDSTMMSVGSAIRQTAIFERVKSVPVTDQFGNPSGCRMKDLIAAFPDVSERTIRYDLQRLLSQGVIERVGNGGPASFYRANSK